MSEKKKTYVLYGASFNPPHQGHLSAINQMLDKYDYVIVFLYPKKHNNVSGEVEVLPPMKQREKMLDLFVKEHFPQINEKNLLVTNLANQVQPTAPDGIIHTIDYLNFVKENLPPNAELHVCMGFEENNLKRAEKFYKDEEIRSKFGVFYLEEENKIESSKLREYFSNNKSVKSVKDMNYIRYLVGNALADYIFENQIYGLKDRIKKSKVDVDDENKVVSPKLKRGMK